jgi:hypothetical protein
VPVQIATPVATANPAQTGTQTQTASPVAGVTANPTVNSDATAKATSETKSEAKASGSQTIENKPAINTSPTYNPPVYPKTPTNGPAPSTGNNNNGVLIITGGKFKDSPLSNNAISGGGLFGSVKIDGPKQDAQNDKSTKTNTGNNQPVTRQQNVGNKTKTETPPVIPGAAVPAAPAEAPVVPAAAPAGGGAFSDPARRKAYSAVALAAGKAGLHKDQLQNLRKIAIEHPEFSLGEIVEDHIELIDKEGKPLTEAAIKSIKDASKPPVAEGFTIIGSDR